MNNNEWITDRLPTYEDTNNGYVYIGDGRAALGRLVWEGEPWKPIPKCEPYVKPKRYAVEWDSDLSAWMINCHYPGYYGMMCVPLNSNCDAHREAAERIAAIYEEVAP